MDSFSSPEPRGRARRDHCGFHPDDLHCLVFIDTRTASICIGVRVRSPSIVYRC